MFKHFFDLFDSNFALLSSYIFELSLCINAKNEVRTYLINLFSGVSTVSDFSLAIILVGIVGIILFK